MLKLRTYTPGVLLALVLAAIAFGLNKIPALALISALLLAIVLGLLTRNIGLVPASAEAGLKFTSKTLLRAGVVLLGLRLSIPDVLALGWGPVLVIIGTVTAVFLSTLALGKAMKTGHAASLLLATGTAICGASAVAGMSSVVRPRKGENLDSAAATSIACITIFGSLAMFIVPPLTTALGLDTRQAGVWVGSSIHEVGQVVAAGGFLGPEVSEVATVTKLGRVVLLAPLVALMGFIEGRSDAAPSPGVQPPALIPGFVLGFLGAVILRSALGWAGLEDTLGGVLEAANLLATFLLTLAMAAMGTGVNLKTVLTKGLPAVGLGAAASLVALGVSLVLVKLLV